MARQPYFSGNYGSALAQIDTRPIMQGAAAQAAAYQGVGQNIGGAIEKYQLNKVKRAKLTGEVEAYLKENPDYINESTMTGDEAADKKSMTQFEKFAAGDLNMAGLEGLAGKLARGDTLRKNKLLEDSQMMQNKMQKFNFGVQQELRDATIQVQKDKATISSLSTAIAKEANPQRKELLQGQLASAIADLGENPAKRRERIAQREEAAATRQALGGPKGVGELAARGATAKVELAEGSVGEQEAKAYYYKSSADAKKIEALAKHAPPAISKQVSDLATAQGRLLGLTLRDPITKGEITFKKYLELNNTEGDDQYPLTGDAAGTAGTYHGNYVTGQRQLQELFDGVNVQVNDTSGGAGVVGGADGEIPSVIDPGKMTQEQANTAVFDRKAEISNQIFNLKNDLGNIGTPGATMPAPVPIASAWGGYGRAPGSYGDQPATVGYDNRKRQEITTNIQALEAELKGLESYR